MQRLTTIDDARGGSRMMEQRWNETTRRWRDDTCDGDKDRRLMRLGMNVNARGGLRTTEQRRNESTRRWRGDACDGDENERLARIG